MASVLSRMSTPSLSSWRSKNKITSSEVVPPGGFQNEVQLAAEPGALFEEDDLVASHGGCAGGFHSGRASAGNDDLFLLRGGGQDAPLFLSTGHGVVDAADAQADEDVPGAALVGAYTVAYLLGAAFTGLVGEVRVGDEGTDHANQVDDTVSEELLGEGGGVDAACAQDGQVDQLLDLVGFVDELAGLTVVAGASGRRRTWGRGSRPARR